MVKLRLILISVILTSSYSLGQYQLQDAFPDLPAFSSPVDFQNAGDCKDRVFVVEQSGIIKVFENKSDISATKTFLNITDRVTSGGELGLLGLTFHPDYEHNGYFYVYYTAPSSLRSVVARYQVTANPDSADKNSEVVLLTQNQPFSNHNAGQLSFGPDGYLYIALGDGGSGGDPDTNGQKKSTFLGKILRIDVDNPAQASNYGIPDDNPFKNNTQGYKEEIYAYGLRNPWRFSFDFETGWLWCGDVGQGQWEEIDIIENGKNYGWRCYEGNHTYNTAGCGDISEYTFPIFEYPHSPECSITGGYVYRGPNQPELVGKYIYGDYCSNKIWALEYDGVNPAANQLLVTASVSPLAFGIDEAKELYVCAENGRILKLVPTAAVVAPTHLSATVISSTVIGLNWIDNSGNENSFNIERKFNNNSYELIITVSANTNSYTDNITNIGNYLYRVSAYNSSDTSGYSNEACVSESVLPVELSLFTIEVSQNDNSVILKWTTSSEKNNHGFEIERYQNNTWATIGFVEGNGTTTEKSSYRFADDFGNHGFSGLIKYRLKQIDFDGSFSYSGSVAIDLNFLQKDYYLKQNYPNPFNPTTTISYNVPEESSVRIELLNSIGEAVDQLVNETRSSGIFENMIDASKFASGVYYVRMVALSVVSNKVYRKTIKMLYLK